MNNRRKLVIALGVCALTAPFGSYAQQQDKVWRVGILALRSRPTVLDSDSFGVFLRGMRDLGYVEGKNLFIEWRSAAGNNERLQDLATELANLNVDVILTGTTPAHRAAQKATTTIPIVMQGGSDPVALGLVKSLARPGGNITGVTNMSSELAPKHLEMLLNMVPKLTRVAVLLNPANSGNLEILKSVQTAARSTNARIVPAEVRSVLDLELIFSAMVREKAEAVIVANDSVLGLHQRQIAKLAANNRLPSIGAPQAFVEAGGLMSYGPNAADQVRRVATYVDKIFKGAKPADLPVEQPTKFELIINGKTAKALGLKIPQSLLISADKVIE